MDLVEFEAGLKDVETKLDRMKALYEQWFQGMERLEPTIPRKEVERRIAALRREHPRNTALRFRFQQLLQRYTTLTTYWGRVARQIEEGTYRRDVMKLRERRLATRSKSKRPSSAPPENLRPLDLDVDAGFEFDVENALTMFDDLIKGAPNEAPSAPAPSVFRRPKDSVGDSTAPDTDPAPAPSAPAQAALQVPKAPAVPRPAALPQPGPMPKPQLVPRPAGTVAPPPPTRGLTGLPPKPPGTKPNVPAKPPATNPNAFTKPPPPPPSTTTGARPAVAKPLTQIPPPPGKTAPRPLTQVPPPPPPRSPDAKVAPPPIKPPAKPTPK